MTAIGVALLVVVTATPARAEKPGVGAEPSAEASRAADEARERGIQLMKEERYADALRAFTDAHKLAPAPRTAAQKGLAEQAMHLWLPAEAHINLALDHGDDPWVKKNRVFLEEAVRDIGAHIGTLSLEFAKQVEGIRLTAAGEWIPWASPRPVRLPEGEITLEIRADGYTTWRRIVVVRPATVIHIPVDLAASVPPTPAPASPKITTTERAVRPTKAPTWLVITMAVVGAGAAASGGYLLAVDGDPACAGGGACASTRRTRVPGMLLVGAGAALGVGSFVVATWHGRTLDRSTVMVGLGGLDVRF